MRTKKGGCLYANDKKVFACILAAALLSAAAVPAAARPAPEPGTAAGWAVAAPRYAVTQKAYSTLIISGSSATVKGYVKAVSGASVEITVRLLLDGEEIRSWSTTGTSLATICKTVTLQAHGTYEVATEYTVTADQGSDSDTVYSDAVEY